jgi:hypothetical protein
LIRRNGAFSLKHVAVTANVQLPKIWVFPHTPAWDNAQPVAYHSKAFEDLSSDEKRAALYLGRGSLDFKLKGVKWNTITDAMKQNATILGWTEETWNRNFPIYDLDINECWWSELSYEQKQAATFFGYNENLWDETQKEEVFDSSVRTCM